MLLDFEEAIRIHHLDVKSVLHIGAHLAEEAPIYDRLGVPALWVEANPDLRERIMWVLAQYPKQGLWQTYGPVMDVGGKIVKFNVTNYDSMSSSIFEFGTHPTFSPDTVFVQEMTLYSQTIDDIVNHFFVSTPKPNTLVMDIQGAELLALRGASDYLPHVDYIYSEINTDEVYVGCAQLRDLSEFLWDHGFTLIAEHMVPGQGWGDGLFVRTKNV